MKNDAREAELPGRWQSLLFIVKTNLLKFFRSVREIGDRPMMHVASGNGSDRAVVGEARALLWSQSSSAEFSLTAGKVENLRVAAKPLHGLEIPAGEVFSFWRQLGRTTKRKGYRVGRELREGCLIPNRGGGLCQLSGLLYQAALQAGLEIVERHGHSHIIPGSLGEQNLDATVFWNYVDLRFRAEFSWRLEVELTATDLVVRIKGDEKANAPSLTQAVVRKPVTGDCLTCQETGCFRHPSATSSHSPSQGHSAFLLDTRWPEFDQWCGGHSREGDCWFVPLDGQRFDKMNYAWSIPERAKVKRSTALTVWRSIQQRKLPSEGAVRQKKLLSADRRLAKNYVKRLSPECRHVVVSQNLLPYLWEMGALGGRTFDMLIERWPMEELQRRLDQAAVRHPESPTLQDFRADESFMKLENDALARAARLITPHRALAEFFGERAWLLDWEMPESKPRVGAVGEHFFLPCSPLGRKGIYDLRSLSRKLLVLGKAREGIEVGKFEQGTMADLATAYAVVLPAWIEHQPRLALKALSMGIPVFATADCGLPKHPCLQIPKRDEFCELACIFPEPVSS